MRKLAVALIIAGVLVAVAGFRSIGPDGEFIGVELVGATLATAGVWLLDFQQHRKKS